MIVSLDKIWVFKILVNICRGCNFAYRKKHRVAKLSPLHFLLDKKAVLKYCHKEYFMEFIHEKIKALS